jgi:microcystin-dependent protein
MSEPFLAEIKMFAGNFAPKGWAFCNGQIMSIAQNTALFSLLGTTYGGDGRTTFALPNLQGAAPLMEGQANGLSLRDLGEAGGQPDVTLIQSEIPIHSHGLAASSAVGGQPPGNDVWSKPSQRGINAYNTDAGTRPAMNATALAPTGGGQPHNNLMPYLVVTFIIALQGIFPARN